MLATKADRWKRQQRTPSGAKISSPTFTSSNQDDHSQGKQSFQYKTISSYRWNVLDLLTFFGNKAVSAHLLCDVDMSVVEAMRKQYEEDGNKLTVTAFILKAIAIAQKSDPLSRTFALPFNRSVTYNDIVAGFTVEREVEEEPIVFFGEIENADVKPLMVIADELRNYSDTDIMSIDKLRQQMIFARMPWLARQIVLFCGFCFPFMRLLCMRATFGVSSLGALGVGSVFGPSVCTCVFGVGAVEDRAVVKHGRLEIRPMMTLSLNYDQRIMDGAPAARFLQEVKRLLETGLAPAARL